MRILYQTNYGKDSPNCYISTSNTLSDLIEHRIGVPFHCLFIKGGQPGLRTYGIFNLLLRDGWRMFAETRPMLHSIGTAPYYLAGRLCDASIITPDSPQTKRLPSAICELYRVAFHWFVSSSKLLRLPFSPCIMKNASKTDDGSDISFIREQIVDYRLLL